MHRSLATALAALVVLLAFAPAALALEVEVREIYESGGFARAEVAVTNDDLRAGYQKVTIRCVWSHRGQPVTQGAATAWDLGYRETAVIEPAAEVGGAVFDSVACDVNWAVEN
jgi:hypothetical protein